MEEMERKEWSVREQEIEKLQAVRLQVCYIQVTGLKQVTSILQVNITLEL